MSLPSLTTLRGKNTPETQNTNTAQRITDKLIAWIPLYLLIGFLALGWYLFGDHIVPGRTVEVATVVTQKASGNSNPDPNRSEGGSASMQTNPFAGEVLFRASGWIEANPFPVRATTLLDGVVDEVFVLEGDSVKKGQLLATLIADDAEIALVEAKALRAGAEAEIAHEETRIRQIEARLKTHALQVVALESELEILRDETRRFEKAGSQAFAEREVRQAYLRAATGEAELAALAAREAELLAEKEVGKQALAIAQRRAEVAGARVQRAELDLRRTRIESPVNGVIQELFVAPGRKRLLGMDDPESATIAKLFQPHNLQARIDVPLEEAARLVVGQPVILRTNFLPEREFHGYVTRIVGSADIQRNTLQTKIELENPDPRLRPEMLCRAEFLATPESGPSARSSRNGSANRVRIFVPEAALVNRENDAAGTWTLDEEGKTAQRRDVRLGNENRDGFVEILEGLRPGDPVIVNPPTDLEAGDRVRPQNPESPSL